MTTSLSYYSIYTHFIVVTTNERFENTTNNSENEKYNIRFVRLHKHFRKFNASINARSRPIYLVSKNPLNICRFDV